jgi:hypothetical protein
MGPESFGLGSHHQITKEIHIMNINEFVTNCLRYSLEFELKWYERTAWDEYCVHIIFRNEEYIVPTQDDYRLEKLWKYIVSADIDLFI